MTNSAQDICDIVGVVPAAGQGSKIAQSVAEI
jgi:hypothetical protein